MIGSASVLSCHCKQLVSFDHRNSAVALTTKRLSAEGKEVLRTVQEQAVRRSRVWAELGVQCMVSAEQAVLREMCTHGATEGVQDAA